MNDLTNISNLLKSNSKLLYLSIFIFLAFDALLFSANSILSGKIITENLKPVESVNIYFKLSKSGTTSIHDGNFYLNNFNKISKNDTLILSCIGYETINIPVKTLKNSNNLLFKLKSKIYKTEPIIFTTEAVKKAGYEQINYRDIRENNTSDNLGDILTQFSSAQISEISGNSTKISIRGSDSDQVLVMVDGIVMNSAIDGSVDLGFMNSLNVEKIEVYKSGNLELSSNSLGGLISITTKKSNFEPGFKSEISIATKGYCSNRDKVIISRFSNNSIGLNLGYITKNVKKRILFDLSYKDFPNEWSFINASKQDQDKSRKDSARVHTNAWYESFNSGIKLSASDFLGKSSESVLSIRYSESKNGLPGWIDCSYYNAYTKSSSFNSKVSYIKEFNSLLKKISFSSYISYQDKYTFINEISPLFYADNKDYLTTVKNNFSFNYSYYEYNLLIALIENYESVKSNNIDGFHKRNKYSLVSTLKKQYSIHNLLKRFNYDLTLREDYLYNSNKKLFSSSLDFGFDFEGSYKPSLSVRLMRNHHLPGFSDLFWVDNLFSRGNPELEPEISNEISIGFNIKKKYLVSSFGTGIEAFYKKVDNLIVWEKKSSGQYIPENRRGGKLSGLESYFEGSYLNFDYRFSYNYLNPIAITDDYVSNNKKIVYKPLSMIKNSLSYAASAVKNLRININHKFQGKMYLNEANTIEAASFNLWSCGVSYLVKKSSSMISSYKFEMNVSNILDKQYQIVYGYPMAGRSLKFKIVAKLN